MNPRDSQSSAYLAGNDELGAKLPVCESVLITNVLREETFLVLWTSKDT
jgi:hypothetical protein